MVSILDQTTQTTVLKHCRQSLLSLSLSKLCLFPFSLFYTGLRLMAHSSVFRLAVESSHQKMKDSEVKEERERNVKRKTHGSNFRQERGGSCNREKKTLIHLVVCFSPTYFHRRVCVCVCVCVTHLVRRSHTLPMSPCQTGTQLFHRLQRSGVTFSRVLFSELFFVLHEATLL